ncbi:MAG: TraB/GumN family protein, partial [Caulobacteraceae bacterium]|nr:TraB/GumN family protein [Caulobacteraceae bacterium]
MREILIGGLAAGLLMVAMAGAAGAQGGVLDQPEDLVSELVVKARTPGPAWWKVSDADTTVWILGSPGLLPESVKWDDSTLKRRLTGANRLILPARENRSISGQMAIMARLGPTGKSLVDRPVADRLPPALFKRLHDDLDRDTTFTGYINGRVEERKGDGKVIIGLGITDTGVDVETPTKARFTSSTSDLYSTKYPLRTAILALAVLKLADAPLGKFVDDPVKRAETLAIGLKTPRMRAGSADSVAALKARAAMPEATQQACLAGALDVLDARERRVAAQRAAALAWAQGDVPAALGRKDRFDMLG